MPNQLPSRVYLSGNSKQRPDVADAQKDFFFGSVDVSSKAVHMLQRDMTPFSTLHELLRRASRGCKCSNFFIWRVNFVCKENSKPGRSDYLSAGCNQSLHMPGQTADTSQCCSKQQKINYNLPRMRRINGFLRGCSMKLPPQRSRRLQRCYFNNSSN